MKSAWALESRYNQRLVRWSYGARRCREIAIVRADEVLGEVVEEGFQLLTINYSQVSLPEKVEMVINKIQVI